jgi:hypothetical protein
MRGIAPQKIKNSKTKFCPGLFLLGIGGLLSNVQGAGTLTVASDSAAWQKPAWLADLSVGVKEGYDDNVFLSGVDPKYYSSGYTVPSGSVAALQNRWSWVTTVSPKVGVNFAPLLGDQKTLQTLSLSYAPDFAIYHDQTSESYDAHRFSAGVKGKSDAFSFGVDDAFTYIDGSDMGPTYPGGYVTAYNVAVPRERREQIQDRATVAFQYDWNHWFIRPTASLLYYDLMTEQLNITGYQNYEDRYDVNGGPDFGYKINSQLALTMGYRYGHQYQQQFSFSPYSSSSDYQRVLLGIEGTPWKWLDVKIQGGPDFRDYDPDTATRTTPVDDRHMVTYYGEASLTATLTPKDALTFKYKGWQWVSSVGKVPYFDSTYDLSYHRKLTDKLGLDLGGRLLTADYTSGNLAACKRNDWQYTVPVALGYAFNAHASVSLAYALDLGRNAQDGIVNPDTRDYDHQLVSLAALFKF